MRRSAALSLVIVVAGAMALFSVLDYVSDLLFNPWALARPSVMGEWAGRLTPGDGVPLALWLELHRAPSAREECVRCSQLEGSALTCDGRGTIRRYSVSGSPYDRRAHRLHLGAGPEASPPPDGLELSTVIGDWDGQDVLAMQADFFWRRGKSAISSTDDPATQPVPVRLERKPSSAFDAMCAELRRTTSR